MASFGCCLHHAIQFLKFRGLQTLRSAPTRLRSLAHAAAHREVRSTRRKPTLQLLRHNSTRLTAGSKKPTLRSCLFNGLETNYYFCVQSLHSVQSLNPQLLSGDEGIRTPGLRLAKAALSQLSYIPRQNLQGVGLSGLEPETSPLSEARSNQLS